MKKLIALILVAAVCLSMFIGCAAKKEKIIIYSCANDRRIALMQKSLEEKFPNYEFIVEYQSTSKLAAKLLATTRLQVQTVALHCGISDVNYFSKIFKRYVKKTPKEYRREIQAQIAVGKR